MLIKTFLFVEMHVRNVAQEFHYVSSFSLGHLEITLKYSLGFGAFPGVDTSLIVELILVSIGCFTPWSILILFLYFILSYNTIFLDDK